MEITLEIYPSLTDFKQSVGQDQANTVQVVDNALQMSIDSLFTEDLDSVSDTVANALLQQTTGGHWLPMVANSHVPAQPSAISP